MESSTSSLPVPPASSGSTTRRSSRAPLPPRREETEDSDKAGRVWARTVGDPWWPAILTLDGGGIRGYSSLMILKALMHEIWLWEQYYDAVDAGNVLDVRTDSPTDFVGAKHRDAGAPVVEAEGSAVDAQADAGAARGRNGNHGELGNDPDAAEGRYGVETDVAVPDTAPKAAINTVVKDESTASVSTRKALSEEELLPCHYFDFMYGTSTGGLIATVIGRLRMTVTEALELYRSVGEDLFGHRRSRIPLVTKYYHQPLEKAVRDIVGARCHEHENCDGEDLHPWDAETLHETIHKPLPFDVDDPRVCQSACLTAVHDSRLVEAHLLRSYPHYYTSASPNWITRYNEGAINIPIWKVTRATTAAPFYFEMVGAEVDGQYTYFKDGGIRENNPCSAAKSEFDALFDGKAAHPAMMLSVGTGKPNTAHDGFAPAWSGILGRIPLVAKLLEKMAVVKNLLIKYTDGEKAHHLMREYARGEHTWYKRLNVDSGLESMPLDDWRRGAWADPKTGEERVIPGGASLTHMEVVTKAYLERAFDEREDSYAPPGVMLRQAAQKLVLRTVTDLDRVEIDPRYDDEIKPFAGYHDHLDHSIIHESALTWLSQLRVIGYNEKLDTAFVTGPGTNSWYSGVEVLPGDDPAVPKESFRDSKCNVDVYEVGDEPKGAFPFHVQCFGILRRVFKKRTSHARASQLDVHKLYTAMEKLRSDDYFLCLKVDYLELRGRLGRQCWAEHISNAGSEPYLTEPSWTLDIIAEARLINKAAEPELILRIGDQLETKSIAFLSQACRHLWHVFDARYWKSSLVADMPYLWEVHDEKTAPPNMAWQHLYVRMKVQSHPGDWDRYWWKRPEQSSDRKRISFTNTPRLSDDTIRELFDLRLLGVSSRRQIWQCAAQILDVYDGAKVLYGPGREGGWYYWGALDEKTNRWMLEKGVRLQKAERERPQSRLSVRFS